MIRRNENVRKIKLVSEILEDKKIKLLGHVMRCESNHPLYQVTFTEEGGFNVYMKKRVGRPRGHWAEDVMNKAMLQCTGYKFDREDDDHHVFLISQAIMRII